MDGRVAEEADLVDKNGLFTCATNGSLPSLTNKEVVV